MRPISNLRRGNCLFQLLLGLAVLGVLLLVVGIVSMVTSKAGDAVSKLQTQIQSFVDRATVFEAPASIEIELEQGGGMVALSPDGMVGQKRIGPPPANVNFVVTITDTEGKPVKFEANTAPRNPGSPFEMLGVFETPAKGRYTVDVKTSDGSSTPAAVMVAAGTQEEAKELANSGVAILQGLGGGCVTICGLLMLLAFGIPALVMRIRAKRARPDPLEHV